MIDSSVTHANRRLVVRLVLVVVAMFGFGFALVPLYSVLCDLTGFGGRSVQQGAGIEAVDESVDKSVAEQRTITVEFIANLGTSAEWEFKPDVNKMKVRLGQFYNTSYFAKNLTGGSLIGQAVYNVAPAQAALYLRKIECFCFSRQSFDPGESKDMPLAFRISPDLPDHISTLTLSYTFFPLTESDS